MISVPTCDTNSLSQIDPKHFFNSLPHALLLLSAERNILAGNMAFYQLVGSSNSDVEALLIDSLFEYSDDYSAFINTPLPSTGILWLKQATGNRIKVVAQLSKFESAGGISSALSIYSFDEAGLGSHFVAGITNDGSWIWDVVKSTTWRSSRWLEVTSRTHEPAKLDSDEVSRQFEFINASENREQIKQKLVNDSALVEGEGFLKCLDGKRKHFSWQGLVVARDSKGEPILCMGSIRDMTPFIKRNVGILQARDNAAHQARLLQLGETLATVSHELNQPLSAIASFASVCKRSINSNTENGRIIAQIETQALRAGTLLRRIRDFAQRGDRDRSTVLLAPILTDVIDWMHTDWRCRDMHIHLSMDSDLSDDKLKIECHRIEIEQIIINLIINAAAAVRSMETPRQVIGDHDIAISVRLNSLTKAIEISVADRGPGLSEALLETIFTPFITTRSDGLGLGLSISKSIANELGGALEYMPRDGGGALFILSLPIPQIDKLDTNHGAF